MESKYVHEKDTITNDILSDVVETSLKTYIIYYDSK